MMTTESVEELKPGFLIEDPRPVMSRPRRPVSGALRTVRALPRILLAMIFLTAGFMKLAATEFEVASFARFGYAPWFMYLIGVLEAVGGLMLLRSRFAAAGALLLSPIMLGAALSHIAAGDGFALATPALALLAALMWLAYAWRKPLLAVAAGGRGRA